MSVRLEVFFLDAEADEESELTIEVSASEKVGAIRGILLELGHTGFKESTPLKYLKQCRELGFEDTVGDVFEAEDSVTIINEERSRAAKSKNIKNQLGEEIRLVILNNKRSEPVFLPVGSTRAASFSFRNFSNKMELYTKSGQWNGENKWSGHRYELPVNSARVQGFVLNSGGLWKNIMGKGPELIEPLERTEDKLERHFLAKPIGRKLIMRIENTGNEPLWIVSGKKENFDVSPCIQPRTEENITLKQNSEGRFKFGPFSLTDLMHEKGSVQVSLFDAQQADNITKISIRRSDPAGKFEASMLLTDEADPQPLESSGNKHYREAERISKKDWLGWIVPNAITAGGTVFSSILSAATGAPA